MRLKEKIEKYLNEGKSSKFFGIDEYAKKWGRDPQNNFSVVSYNMNSLEELKEPHKPKHADKTDCKRWNISPEEWSDAIEAALNQKLADE